MHWHGEMQMMRRFWDAASLPYLRSTLQARAVRFEPGVWLSAIIGKLNEAEVGAFSAMARAQSCTLTSPPALRGATISTGRVRLGRWQRGYGRRCRSGEGGLAAIGEPTISVAAPAVME